MIYILGLGALVCCLITFIECQRQPKITNVIDFSIVINGVQCPVLEIIRWRYHSTFVVDGIDRLDPGTRISVRYRNHEFYEHTLQAEWSAFDCKLRIEVNEAYPTIVLPFCCGNGGPLDYAGGQASNS
jgi:hypothetical protein